jgi:nucleosome assembly protein 1-like 1
MSKAIHDMPEDVRDRFKSLKVLHVISFPLLIEPSL